MKWIKRAALFVWEFPQNALGIANAALVMRKIRRATFERERVMIEVPRGTAVSLGLFVFYTSLDNPYVPVGLENADHEWGHSVQSRWLGPLYLPLVGLPSSMRATYAFLYKRVKGKRWAHYYDGWPEKQADRLGRVDRSKRPAP